MIAHHVLWPATITITPVVTDDGWGGELTYEWTQLSGPGTSTITDGPIGGTGIFDPAIFDPAIFDISHLPNLQTTFSFPEITGVYLFEFKVTRGDGLIGISYHRIAVYTIVEAPESAANTGSVSLTVNGTPIAARINSVSIDNNLDTPTCLFQVFGRPVEPGNEVILERGGVRLFGGICLSVTWGYVEGILVSSPSLVGYAWHLGRTLVTKNYQKVSMNFIIGEMLSLAPGGLTNTIASGLPTTTLSVRDVYIKDVLDQLAAELQDGHWYVDYNKRLHFGVLEPSGDPLPLSNGHPWFKDLTVQRDLSQTVNRVVVYYTIRETRTDLIDALGRVRVSSLEGIPPSGEIMIEGNKITYSGTSSALVNPVYGTVQIQLTTESMWESGGELTQNLEFGYEVTLVTALGETPPVMTLEPRGISIFSTINALQPPRLNWIQPSLSTPRAAPYGWEPGDQPPAYNAILIGLGRVASRNLAGVWTDGVDGIVGNPAITSRITALNIYRTSREFPPGGRLVWAETDPTESVWSFFVGSLSPHGGVFIDKMLKNTIEGRFKGPPTVNTADEMGYYLLNCVITEGAMTEWQARIVEDDTSAQSELSSRLGGGSGVIEAVVDAGGCSRARAHEIARAYLANRSKLMTEVGVTLRDEASSSGQILSVYFPELELAEDLKIQQVSIAGFEKGVQHEYRVTAASHQETLENLIKPKRQVPPPPPTPTSFNLVKS